MRTFLCLAIAGLAACADAPYPSIPLGHLVANGPRPVIVVPPPPRALLLPPNETTIWDVRAGGMTIGRAEVDIGDTDVHSKFSTTALASMFTSMKHDLVTTIDRGGGRPQTAIETVTEGHDVSHSEVAFDGTGYAIDHGAHAVAPDGNPVHTLHSALGWIRSWATPDAAPSSLYVLEDRELFRIDLDRPTRETLRDLDTLRIDGHMHVDDLTIAISMWVAADGDRRPIRITITAAKLHIVAELVT